MTFPYSQKPQTPPSQPIPGREADMVKNDAGGFVFKVSDDTILDRFVILGTVGGTFYASEQKVTREAMAAIERLFASPAGAAAVRRIALISDEGRAVKNSPAIAALALATLSPREDVRKEAFASVSKVCRTGTHLFEFCEYREAFGGGWGRLMRAAITNWYASKKPHSLASQLLKYPSRNGWSHRDLMRLAHPVVGADLKPLLDVTCHPAKTAELLPSLPEFYRGVHLAREAKSPKAIAAVVREFNLVREMLPTESLNHPEVWEALLYNGMPLTAMLRNLGNMAKHGLLTPLSDASKYVAGALSSKEGLARARIHPLSVLLAMKTYGQGHGMKGSGKWNVNQNIVDALDAAFYMTFTNVEPTGKNIVFGVDVSGSMTSPIAGLPISSAEAAGAMALVIAATEPNHFIGGFSHEFVDLGISPSMRLDEACARVQMRNFGGTNAAIAMQHATESGIKADAFALITDNDTWAGDRHAQEALRGYRRWSGLPTKLAVIATTARPYSVADHGDPGTLDLVGFDAAMPVALNAFIR
jgi:60 kDa SS-A/Ro ribonucleoprotein